jgi:hypothetical protein
MHRRDVVVQDLLVLPAKRVSLGAEQQGAVEKARRLDIVLGIIRDAPASRRRRSGDVAAVACMLLKDRITRQRRGVPKNGLDTLGAQREEHAVAQDEPPEKQDCG